MVDGERLIVGQPAEDRLRIIRTGRQRIGQIPKVLVEERHLDVRMGVVEVDGGLQRPARHRHADARAEIRRHVVAEFEKQYEELAIGRCEIETRRIQVNHRGACRRELPHGSLKRVQDRLRRRDERVESAQPHTRHAELCSLQPMRVHELRVVRRDIRGTGLARSLPA